MLAFGSPNILKIQEFFSQLRNNLMIGRKCESLGKGIRGTGGYYEGKAYGSTINLNRQVK
jgi:hypothetical protein